MNIFTKLRALAPETLVLSAFIVAILSFGAQSPEVAAHSPAQGSHPLDINMSVSETGGTVSVSGTVESGLISCNINTGETEGGFMCNCCNPDDFFPPGGGNEIGGKTCSLGNTISYSITGPENRSGTASFSSNNSPGGCTNACLLATDSGTSCQETDSFSFSEVGLPSGSYSVAVTASDCDGSETHTHSFTVANQCSFTAGFTADGQTGTINVGVGDTVTFETSVTSQSNCAASWRHRVDIGDDGSYEYTSPTGALLTRTYDHPFPTAGTFQVGSTIRNGDAGINEYPADITVVVADNNPTLDVTISGNGTVSGISGFTSQTSCGSGCTRYTYNNGANVSPVGNPGSGWDFGFWTGACSGSNQSCNPSTLSMTTDRAITAVFQEAGCSPVNGACGTANNQVYGCSDSSYAGAGHTLCITGDASPSNPSFPASGQTEAWSCLGTCGGTNASCSASKSCSAVSCGAAATNYASGDTSFSGAFCSSGSPSPSSPSFPSQGGTTNWDCGATTCTATRDAPAPGCGEAARNYYYNSTFYDYQYNYPNPGEWRSKLCDPLSQNPDPEPPFPNQGSSRSWQCGSNTCTATRDPAPPTQYRTKVALSGRNISGPVSYPNMPALVSNGGVSNTHERIKVMPNINRGQIAFRGTLDADTTAQRCYSRSKAVEYTGNNISSFMGAAIQTHTGGSPHPDGFYPHWSNAFNFFHSVSPNAVGAFHGVNATTFSPVTEEMWWRQPGVIGWEDVYFDREYALWCEWTGSGNSTSRVFTKLVGDIQVVIEDDSGMALPSTWTLSGPEVTSISTPSADQTVEMWLGPNTSGSYTLSNLPALGGYGTPVVSYTTGDNPTPTVGNTVALTLASAPVVFTVEYPENVCDYTPLVTVNGQTGTVDVAVNEEFDIEISSTNMTGPCNEIWWRYDRDIDYANHAGWAPNAPQTVTTYDNNADGDETIQLTYTYTSAGSNQIAARSVNNPGGGSNDPTKPLIIEVSNTVNVNVGTPSATISANPSPTCEIEALPGGDRGETCSTDLTWTTSFLDDHVIGYRVNGVGPVIELTTGVGAQPYNYTTGGLITNNAFEFGVYAIDGDGDATGSPYDTVEVTGVFEPQCSDEEENNDAEDTLTDAADPGCHTDGDATDGDATYDPLDDDERDGGLPQCSDGFDNDGDDLTDLSDPGCEGDPDKDDETNDQYECSNGFDDDGDGFTDFGGGDPDCDDHFDNREAGDPDIRET